MKNFKDKVAVITGGAAGLGREFAITAHKLGMKLVLADVQQDALNATTAELNQACSTRSCSSAGASSYSLTTVEVRVP